MSTKLPSKKQNLWYLLGTPDVLPPTDYEIKIKNLPRIRNFLFKKEPKTRSAAEFLFETAFHVLEI
jgi:hypothetical protein